MQKNWKGDGVSAYAQSNGRLMVGGDVAVSQMDRASAILDQTADAIDAGKRMQDAAQKDWDTAEWYMRIEQPAAAVPYYTSAEVLRATAGDILMEAQANFHTGFAALTEEISTHPRHHRPDERSVSGAGD